VFSIEIEAKREIYIRVPQRRPYYKRRFPMKGIRLDVYPREGVIHNFQAPSIVQKHRE
jgi:hypothetical protein